MTDVPESLIQLVETQKPTDLALGFLNHHKDHVLRALNYEMTSNPRGGPMSYDAFTSSVALEVASNPRLAAAVRASPVSFMKSVLLAAQCKLLVGGSYGLFYLIPRKNRGVEEVTPMIGYKGMCEMAQRHPRVHKVEAFLVYEGEDFEWQPGAGKLRHVYGLDVDRSDDKLIAAYARVVITEPESSHPVLDDPVVWVMSRKEILAVRNRSDAYKGSERSGRKDSPWHTDFAMMARKTVLRAVLTKGAVPRDMGVGGAIAQEDEADQIREAPARIPAPTMQAEIRQGLGIDTAPPTFDTVEEALAALDAAESPADCRRVADGCQHFQGIDAAAFADAYEEALTRFETEA